MSGGNSATEELRRVVSASEVTTVAGAPGVRLTTAGDARALAEWCRAAGKHLRAWNGHAEPLEKPPAETVLVAPTGELAGNVTLALEDDYAEFPAPASLAAITRTLDPTPRWLPFATPRGSALTAGEAVDLFPANAFAPLYGELNRLVIGLRIMDDEGSVFEIGRRTIKGVAGYDLVKLFLGARGRAGLVCRVRFRVFPRPRGAALWRAVGPDSAVQKVFGVCRFTSGNETLLYAEGYAETIRELGRTLRETAGELEEIAAGAEATATFAAAADKGEPLTFFQPTPLNPIASSIFI